MSIHFEVGDRVRNASTGNVGTVTGSYINSSHDLTYWYVQWDDGGDVTYGWRESLELIPPTAPPTVRDWCAIGQTYCDAAAEQDLKNSYEEKLLKRFGVSVREALLKDAAEAVTKQRNNSYGPPTQDFKRTAALWTILFNTMEEDGYDTTPFNPSDVAIAMIALKLSRLTWDPKNKDSWMDIAGYAACGYECSLEEDE